MSITKERPSRRAQSSAMTLDADPICLVKPLNQFPSWSQITPPPPAGPGLPFDEPSVFNLIHPGMGGVHWTQIGTEALLVVEGPTIKKNSQALCKHIATSLSTENRG